MIRDVVLLQRLAGRQSRNIFLGAFAKYPLLTPIFAIAAGGFLWGYWELTWMLMRFIYKQEVFGVILAAKLVQFLFYVALGVAVMSSLTTAITNFFMSKDLEFQFSLPVSLNSWMIHRFMQTYLQSNWMLLVFACPFIWVYLSLSEANLVMRCVGLFIFIAASCLPVLVSTIACILLVKIFPARRIQQVFLVLTILFASSMVLVFRFMEPEQFIGPGGIDRFRGFMDLVDFETFSWNPAAWASNLVTAIGQSDSLDAAGMRAIVIDGIALSLLLGLLFGGLLWVGQRFYRASWDRALQALSGEEGAVDEKRKLSFLSRKLSHWKWGQESRELLLFVRDPTQWSQVFVLLMLLVLYLFSIAKLPTNPFGGTRYSLALGNTAFVAFVCLSVTSRFVFTSFSADGQALWLMKTVPEGWVKFMRSKLLVYGVPTVVFAELLAVLSGVMLSLSPDQLFVIGLGALWDSLLMVFLGLALGMLFINPGIENPLKLMVSTGGFLLMAVGAILVGVHVLLRLSVNSHLINILLMRFGWPDVQDGRALWYYLGLILAEALLLAYLLRRGILHLRRGDFA